MALSGERGVAAAHAVFGSHHGHRALHAKGTLLKGTFTATPEAAELTRAAHMQGTPVPVTVRVSNGSGDPRAPDYAPDVRGFAVKFYLPDGTRTDLVAQTQPRFPVREPQGFVELLEALGSGRRILYKLPLSLLRHPEAIPILPFGAGTLRPPVSYAAIRYYAIHAYRFLDAEGGSRYVRYTLVPEREQPRLWPHQACKLGRDYLQDEIRERVAKGPVRFTLELQIARPGDAVDDPTSVWPADRRRVTAGTIELTGLDTERETGGDILLLDPTRVPDGIELSDDPILRYRTLAYSESVKERM